VTEILDKEYQTKATPNNKGRTIFRVLLILVFKIYFKRLVASSGNTNEGLKVLAFS